MLAIAGRSTFVQPDRTVRTTNCRPRHTAWCFASPRICACARPLNRLADVQGATAMPCGLSYFGALHCAGSRCISSSESRNYISLHVLFATYDLAQACKHNVRTRSVEW